MADLGLAGLITAADGGDLLGLAPVRHLHHEGHDHGPLSLGPPARAEECGQDQVGQGHAAPVAGMGQGQAHAVVPDLAGPLIGG
ncbi:hypothetical protein D3C72_2146180 [compost metagenome]